MHKLFEIPSVVLVGGIWKTGKTDFALYIAETLLNLPSYRNPVDCTVVNRVASNIETHGTFPMISDMLSLRQWLYETSEVKLFILDEANVHLPSRRSMSGKSVEIVKLLAEVSKAHARMIVIAQELTKIDKEFLNPTWVRGVFIKRSLKKAQLISHLLEKQYAFNNIPKTSIPFDPYAVAPFTEKPASNILFKDEDMQKLWDWSDQKQSYKELGFTHPQQFNRWLRRNVKKLLNIELSPIHTNKRRG